jgi:hypothetical protein
MKFFNIDLHIAVISDIKQILLDKGHEVNDWTLSSHSWILGRDRDLVDVVNNKNWRSIDEEMCMDFYKRYKDELSIYDCFIVTHTPCFAMLFKLWKKPIIIVTSTRYEYPFTENAVKWHSFNDFLKTGIDDGKIIPVANNKYDAAYTEYFTKRTWNVIPSICEYTGMQYQPIGDGFLYWSKYPLKTSGCNITDKGNLAPNKFQKLLNRLPFLPKHLGFEWKDVCKYNGIIHIPYNVSIMSIFEQYTANIPLFFPTKNLLLDLAFNTNLSGALSEISFNQVNNIDSGSIIGGGENDPNDYKCRNNVEKWLSLADYYDEENMPFINYFNTLDEIQDCIHSVDLNKQSASMKKYNEHRKKMIYARWDAILKLI